MWLTRWFWWGRVYHLALWANLPDVACNWVLQRFVDAMPAEQRGLFFHYFTVKSLQAGRTVTITKTNPAGQVVERRTLGPEDVVN